MRNRDKESELVREAEKELKESEMDNTSPSANLFIKGVYDAGVALAAVGGTVIGFFAGRYFGHPFVGSAVGLAAGTLIPTLYRASRGL